MKDIIETRERLSRKASRQKKLPKVQIDWMRPEDVLAALELDRLVYHELFLAEAERYMNWRKKNPYISMAAFDARDRRICLAYVGLIPLPETLILDILLGKRDEKEITAEEIETYDHPGEYTLLANSAVTHPDYPELISAILHKIMEFWLNEQYPERRVSRIYAQTVSEQGRIMAKKLYLGPLYIIENGKLAGVKDAYVLDMKDTAASRVIRKFQEDLRAKEQSNRLTEKP